MFQSSPAVLACRGLLRPSLIQRTSQSLNRIHQNRQLLTLAIESSCDDTSVAVLEKHASRSTSSASPGNAGTGTTPSATLHFLENVTVNPGNYKGIHPIAAHESHQSSLAKLVNKAIQSLPETSENDPAKIVVSAGRGGGEGGASAEVARRKPDFISVTRGPGMRGALITGLDTAKGLAVAWQVPMVGVHHMQAHLLTPELVTALGQRGAQSSSSMPTLQFPWVSLLVSGGHTLLAHSKSPFDHSIVVDTVDTAVGHIIDKVAKLILPSSYTDKWNTAMYGQALEAFAFPNGPRDYRDYRAPATREQEQQPTVNTKWGWEYRTPFAESRTSSFSFSGIFSQTQMAMSDRKSRAAEVAPDKQNEGNFEENDPEAFLPHDGRVAMARDFMTSCFEHIASRTVMALEDLWIDERMETFSKVYNTDKEKRVHARTLRQRRMHHIKSGGPDRQDYRSVTSTLVVSGGVASNEFLLTVLRDYLDQRGFTDVEIVAPPPELCTDNAAMIGWTGMEMYQAGWSSDLGIRSAKEWSLDSNVENGGIFGLDGWVKDGEKKT